MGRQMHESLDPGLVHPELAPLVHAMAEFTISAETLPDVRAGSRVGPPVSTEAVERTDHIVDDARGIVIRLHRPRNVEGRRPCAFSIHGGGYVLGNRAMDDVKLTDWVTTLGCI